MNKLGLSSVLGVGVCTYDCQPSLPLLEAFFNKAIPVYLCKLCASGLPGGSISLRPQLTASASYEVHNIAQRVIASCHNPLLKNLVRRIDQRVLESPLPGHLFLALRKLEALTVSKEEEDAEILQELLKFFIPTEPAALLYSLVVLSLQSDLEDTAVQSNTFKELFGASIDHPSLIYGPRLLFQSQMCSEVLFTDSINTMFREQSPLVTP